MLGLGFGDSVVTAVFKMELLELICKKKKYLQNIAAQEWVLSPENPSMKVQQK